ncbi:HEAT repeat domain-containing protein [Pandoraea apista]|uniref:HEAT repeat domain-containing protein n=1 Tax=Pandoraea apista TaxID=93218 RepID=UPI000F66546B|nr:HEAT repeat domain-containing protein [Pandoraea apista]RRW94303.1 hypothetical protein EGJ54_18375 [Pandoraea apista]RRX00662.1 hypothetical protein EGJ56_19020 [Pandoraea apista]
MSQDELSNHDAFIAAKQRGLLLLLKTLKDESEAIEIRAAAAEGLGYSGGRRALEALQAVAEKPSEYGHVKSACLIALGRAMKPQ